MYYPACDSPRGFIEADMGLVGVDYMYLIQKTMPYTCSVSGEDRTTDVVPRM